MGMSYTFFVEHVDCFVLHESSNVTRYVDAELAPRPGANAICKYQLNRSFTGATDDGSVYLVRHVQTNGTGTMKLVTPKAFA